MFRVAIKMLVGDRGKYAGLIFGIAFTSFLVTYAACFFTGFMTRAFSLISENPDTDVWVMDPTVSSVEQTTNIPASALDRVRSVAGVRFATPLALGTAEVRFPNGRFQSFQVIGVDDGSLVGAPALPEDRSARALRVRDAAIVAEGGTDGKLLMPELKADQWPADGPHLEVPTRLIATGDEVEVNEHRVIVAGVADALPRFPPRCLLYTPLSKASQILLPERHRLTFVLASVVPGADPAAVAARIERQTGLRARTADEFKKDTVLWYLVNCEDVGDVTTMLVLAITVGFGVTGVMLYMFTQDSLKHYAVLKAMGATPRMLAVMILAQAGTSTLVGTGIGLGACGIASLFAGKLFDMPFRMMWFTPLAGLVSVVVVGLVAAAVSMRPVFKLEPATVFGGR